MIDNYAGNGVGQSILPSVKGGGQAAFENLYDVYSAPLLGVIAKITGAGKIAEDVLQQAFLEIWQKREMHDDSKERIFTWMIKIAVKVAMLAARPGNLNAGGEIAALKNLVYGVLEAGSKPDLYEKQRSIVVSNI
ncbi:MAG: sigma factor [Bacteroidota bacterium]